jgi:hypothetical protein
MLAGVFSKLRLPSRGQEKLGAETAAITLRSTQRYF